MTSNFYLDDTPEEVKNAKGLHLVTQSTPNGKKVQIYLEELKEVYGIEYTKTLINISTNEQKKDWFLKLNPNGRIPILVDNNRSPPFPVMETSAELVYLSREFDKKSVFDFTDEFGQSECTQWLFFWHGSGQPIQGQLGWFNRNAPDNTVAINRFRNEVLRIFGVIELQLSGKYTGQVKEYLAGSGEGKYSVADISAWPWVSNWRVSKLTQEEMNEFPHLLKWIDRIAQRPAVQRGIDPKVWSL